MNGSVTKYDTEQGTRWCVRWDLPDGDGGQRRQRRKRGYTTKAEAAKYLRHVLSEQDHGRPVQRTTETVAEAVESFLTAKRAARKQATTLDLWANVLRVHVVPRLGHVRTSSVSVEQVERLYASLALHGKAVRHGKAGTCRTSGVTCSAFAGCSPERHAGLSPTMLRHVHTTFRAVLRRSLGERASLPTDATRARDALPAQESQRVNPDDYWNDAQARAFITATADDKHGAAFALALATGLRRSELAGLRWSDIELEGDDAHLWIRRTITSVRGRMVVKDGGKSKAAVRKVPLGAVAVRVLKDHRKAQAAAQLAAGSWTDTGAVFAESDGEHVNPAALTRAFTKATGAAKLPRVGLHGARHYAITSMLRRGVPVTTVAKQVGHERPSITFDVYSHAIPDDARLAAAAQDAALGGIDDVAM